VTAKGQVIEGRENGSSQHQEAAFADEDRGSLEVLDVIPLGDSIDGLADSDRVGKRFPLLRSAGKNWLDFHSQLVIGNIGHGDPREVHLVAEQISELAYVNSVTMTTEVHALLVEKLEKLPRGDIDRLFPPLCITEAELAVGFEVLERALEITDRAVTG
jgi:adenosylmethionine-8-amino-7-oxononanoate aminotransferase